MKKNSIFKKNITLLFIILFFSSYAQLDIVGQYDVHGLNPNGTKYGGKVTISKIVDNKYDVTWVVASSTTKGNGILENKTLTVNYGETLPAVYIVKESGNYLDGIWGGGSGKEALTKVGVKTNFKEFVSENTCYCCSKKFAKGTGHFWYKEGSKWNIFKESQDLLKVGVGKYCCSVKCCNDCKHSKGW